MISPHLIPDNRSAPIRSRRRRQGPPPPLPHRALRFPTLMPNFYPTRALAISTYSASRSMPMYWNPSRFAATSVDPLPANGSSTIPSGGVTNRQSHAIRSVGLTVGWLFARFVCIFVACSGVPLYSPYVRAGLSGKLISSPRQSLFRSFFDAFFDNSGGVTLKYLLKKASGSVVTQFAGKRP